MRLGNERHVSHYLAYFLFLFLPVLGGCSATGPKFTELQSQMGVPQEGKARIFFLRKATFEGSGDIAQIHVNGKHVKDLRNGGFVFVDVNAGSTSLKVDSGGWGNVGEWVSTIDALPAEEHYFLVAIDMDRNWFADIHASLTDTPPPDAPYRVSHISQRMASNILPTLNLSETNEAR